MAIYFASNILSTYQTLVIYLAFQYFCPGFSTGADPGGGGHPARAPLPPPP